MQPVNVGDHPRGEPRGLLPDVAGGACERGRLQHPAAAEHRRAPLRQFIVCLAQVLCLVSTCQESDRNLDHEKRRDDTLVPARIKNFQIQW